MLFHHNWFIHFQRKQKPNFNKLASRIFFYANLMNHKIPISKFSLFSFIYSFKFIANLRVIASPCPAPACHFVQTTGNCYFPPSIINFLFTNSIQHWVTWYGRWMELFFSNLVNFSGSRYNQSPVKQLKWVRWIFYGVKSEWVCRVLRSTCQSKMFFEVSVVDIIRQPASNS